MDKIINKHTIIEAVAKLIHQFRTPDFTPLDDEKMCEMLVEAMKGIYGTPPEKPSIGKWVALKGCSTPGGTPVYVCEKCGGSEHLHGVEYPKRKLICDTCGSVNYYPWEQIYDDQET